MAKRRHGRKPTAKAKAAYNHLIVKGYRRLRSTMARHNPRELDRIDKATP